MNCSLNGAATVLEAVTVTRSVKGPDCVGVPERRPALDSGRPAGSVDDVVNVAAPIAPLCVNAAENGEPACVELTAGLVTVMLWQPMWRLYVVPTPVQPWLSVTLTTMGNVPTTLGVPERTPLEESVSAAGSAPLTRV